MPAQSVPTSPPTVAVIGCGPGGMFLLHALATMKKTLREEGKIDALSKLPKLTCFERSSLPGGVWRAERDDQAASTTNMYDGLWINSAKESFEFFDYTFDEHFKCPKPSFIPRKECYEYILGRVTQHEDIFQDVQFNTNVDFVTFDEKTQKFSVSTTRTCDDVSSTSMFDKCVWAGGLNGKPKMIPSLLEHLEGFKGEILHSSEMNRLESMITNKRILMIGGNYSAEDLALQCTKLGSGKIFITSRCNEGIVSCHGLWPRDNVEVLEYRIPCGVRSDGSTIVCRTTYYDEDSDGSDDSDDDDSFDEPQTLELKDIDIIVFCTGYTPNTDFLDPSLNIFLDVESLSTWKLPKKWKMEQNALTDVLGHIKPSKKLRGYSNDIYTGEGRLYDVVKISNPNMMYIVEGDFDVPLLEVDVKAYGCMRYLTGDLVAPSEEEMLEAYREDLRDSMDDIDSRLEMDRNYEDAVFELLPKDHWYSKMTKDHVMSAESFEFELNNERATAKAFAWYMVRFEYPSNLGDEDELTEKGESLAQYAFSCTRSRYDLAKFAHKSDAGWITFRDLPQGLKSMYTGTEATQLKGRWINLDDEGNEKKKVHVDSTEEKKD